MPVSVGKTMRQLIAAVGIAVILSGSAATASAQTTPADCIALIGVLQQQAAAGQNNVDTLTRAGVPASMAIIHMALDPLFLAEHYAANNCSDAGFTPAAPVDEGITVNLGNGSQQYLARGAFVKIGDAPAIYWVYGGQLHSFSTWPQFLGAGGQPDLSNVVRFSSFGDPNGRFYGSPVR